MPSLHGQSLEFTLTVLYDKIKNKYKCLDLGVRAKSRRYVPALIKFILTNMTNLLID